MASKVEQYRKDNECIERRYERAQKAENIKEIYAARADYQANIDKQKDELNKMDKSSQEYRDAKASLDEQESKVNGMNYYTKEGSDLSKVTEKMDEYKYENQDLGRQMDKAIAKGDTRKYDELSRKYETNVKAQEGIAAELKMNGIEHENTIERQKIEKRNLDMDMRDKMQEKISQAQEKGKKPSEKDMADLEKYSKISKDEERKALEEIDNRKLKEMESYGISAEEIEKERQQRENARNRLLGEEKQR